MLCSDTVILFIMLAPNNSTLVHLLTDHDYGRLDRYEQHLHTQVWLTFVLALQNSTASPSRKLTGRGKRPSSDHYNKDHDTTST